MTAESWARVQELFQAALDKPLQDRAAFLLEACPQDTEVRAEVESLLAHSGSADSFLESSPVGGSSDAKPVLMPGQRLGRFEIIEIIGRGGIGEVYRARDRRLHRDIAIKVLRSLRLVDAGQRRRFLHEAQAASALSHPNIVTIYDVGEAEGLPFIAMEYVAGKTLAELIGSGGLRAKEAVDIAVQIAAALEKAHATGIIHRDLKPGNVMVTAEGGVKVLDFGIAKLATSGGEERTGDSVTSVGVVVGTADYMSPEQAEGQPLDGRSDVFSFGSMLYEMLAGRRPFQSVSGVSTLVSILTKEPPELSTAVPSGLRAVVARCLRKNRNDRFGNMAKVNFALKEIQSQLEPRRSPEFVRHRRLLRNLAIGLSVLCAFGVVLWRATRRAVAPPQVVPFTSYPGSERHPSFSPDSKKIVFSWNGEQQDNNSNVYVKQIGAAATPLRVTTSSADDLSPAFSPDGSSIGFVRVSQGHASFMLIPASGGPERVVSVLATSPPGCAEVGCNLFSWFPDGKHVVMSGLELLNIESGETRVLTSPPNRANPDECPAVSPDGKAVAFARMPGVQMLDIWTVGLNEDFEASGIPRRLTKRSYNAAPFSLDPAWTPDGREIIFSDGRLWRVPASGRQAPQSLPFEGLSPVMSHLSHKLAYVRFDKNTWELYRVRLGSDGRATGAPTPFALSTGGDLNPQYSPDGKHVAFESARSGEERIWISEADGANALPLPVDPDMYEGSPRWSPDGKFLTFDSDSTGQWHVYVIPATGGKAKRLTADGASHHVPTWSRNGEWIYFASTATGRSEIWKVASQGGQAVQVTKNGGFEGWESTDGKNLYFTKDGSGDQGLWRMPFDTGAEQQIAPAIRFWSFAVSPRGVYYISQAGAGQKDSIQFLSFGTNITTRVMNLDRTGDAGLTVSPDGQFLLYVQTAKSNSDIMLVENFE